MHAGVYVCVCVPRIGTVNISAVSAGSLLCRIRRVSKVFFTFAHIMLSPASEAVSLLACSSDSEVSDCGVMLEVRVFCAVVSHCCGIVAWRAQCLHTSDSA